MSFIEWLQGWASALGRSPRGTSHIRRAGAHGGGDSLAASGGGTVTALISNLLPVMGNKSGLGSPGIYVGEGLPPVPAKLAKTIRRWEFTEMSELLPEYWGFVSGAKSEEDESLQARRIPAQKKRKVTDIDTWLQCFGTYIAVMAGGSPEAVPELIAYQLFILGASQDYEGLAWVTYDAAFRRQAAATGNRQWSRVNPSLHSICFAGAAKRAVRCDLCLSRTHQTRDCALVSDPDPEMGTRLRLLEAALSALTWKQATSTSGATQARAVTSPRQYSPYGGEPEPCRKWNEKRCGYRRCRYPHVCSECGGAHPAVECPIRPLTGPLMPDPRGARGLMYPQGGLRRPPPEQPIHPRGGFGPTRGQPRAPGTGRPY